MDQAGLRQPGELTGETLRLGPRLTDRHDSVDQAHPLGLPGVDGAPGEDEVHRTAGPDQLRQPHRPAVDQWHAPAAAEDPEHRVTGGDAQVAPGRELQATGHRVALDRGDDGLGQPHPGGPHRAVGGEGIDDVALRRTDGLEVGAGAERATVAVEDRDPLLGVGVEDPEGLGQRRSRRAVDGVAGVRAVDDDGGDRTVALHAHRRPQGCGGHARVRHAPDPRAVGWWISG